MINLKADQVLQGVVEALREKVVPALADDPYAAEQARLALAVLSVVAQQVDGLAAVRAAENADIRALFAEAAGLTGGDLADRLAAAATGTEPGLKVSELDAEGARLRLLLVELHAALETAAGDAARAMHQRIWRLLRDMEERRV